MGARMNEPRIPQPAPESRSQLKALRAWWAEKNLLPPHIILWRMLWAAPAYVGGGITALALLVGWGPDHAKRFWGFFR